jgi:phosphoenolpyruvate-protein kinase (PTS system EI component)
MRNFQGIGMVRGEYIFRAEGYYPSPSSVSRFLVPYLQDLCTNTNGQTVWYRTLDADTAECNVLEGVEEIIVEPDRLLGLRGIRRSIRYPEAFRAELEGVAQVRAAGGAAGVIFPFVTYVSELEWAISQVNEVAPGCPVATMVEVPSMLVELGRVLDTGVSRLVIGCNDLSSMLLARGRTVRGPIEPEPPLVAAIGQVVKTAHQAGVTVGVAGYLHPDLIKAASDAGADECVIHYSDLPRLFGDQWAGLPDLGVLAATKQKTRDAIGLFNKQHGADQRIY